MKKLLYPVCALLLLGGFVVGMAHQAALASGSRGIPQDNYTRPSRSNDVGMMFYKLIGSVPVFEDWIKAAPHYQGMTPRDQAEYLVSETARLQQAFAALNIEKTAIVIRTALKVEIISRPPKMPGDPVSHVLRLDLPPNNEVYFPYKVGDQMIAVIPNGVDLYREIPLTPAEAIAIKNRLDITGLVTLVLEIPPKMADGSAPVLLNNVPQWLLIGEIGFLGIYNSSTDVLWSYQAPYYILQGQDVLLDLRSNTRTDLDNLKFAPAPSVP
jgi:hypothetical protein